MTWIAGYNQPGYLPTTDPAEFDTFDEAKRFIIGEIEEAADQAGDGDDEEMAEDLASEAEDINLESGPFSVLCSDGHAYWVVEE